MPNTEMSLWEEILSYLYQNYFSAGVGDQYTYLSFNNHTATTLFALVMGLCLGMIVAAVLGYRQQRNAGQFVRRLLKKEAHSPQTAVSFADLDLHPGAVLRHAVKHNLYLRKLLCMVDGTQIRIRDLAADEITPEMTAAEWARDKGGTPPTAQNEAKPLPDGPEAPKTEKPLFGTPEWRAQRRAKRRAAAFDPARVRYYIPEELRIRASLRYEKDRNGLLSLIVAIVGFTALGFLLIRFMPFFLGLLDTSLAKLAGQ